MKFDVIGFGALNIDRLYRVDRIAGVGEERFIRGYSETPGGSAANTIVGLARLGHKVGYVGKVGDDSEDELLLNDFKDEGVDTRGIIVSDKFRTGVVIGFVDDSGERTLYVDPGANDSMSLEEVDRKYISNTKFLHLSSFVGEKPFETQKFLLQDMPNVKVSFDPGELYVRRGLAALSPILRRCFVVFPNEDELRLLTGREFIDGARTLIELGVKIVAVKLGEKGCYITNGDESFLINSYKVNVVDSTGAGDAFCAGFLHGLLSCRDLRMCGQIANFIAARKIEKVGAREGLPRLSDLPVV
ncbi:MAG: ribokinase [Thermoproteota archaeon]|nr:ribokinase [Thermoproteota archaeon]